MTDTDESSQCPRHCSRAVAGPRSPSTRITCARRATSMTIAGRTIIAPKTTRRCTTMDAAFCCRSRARARRRAQHRSRAPSGLQRRAPVVHSPRSGWRCLVAPSVRERVRAAPATRLGIGPSDRLSVLLDITKSAQCMFKLVARLLEIAQGNSQLLNRIVGERCGA